MRTWIVPSNPNRYRLIDFLIDHNSVYWVQYVNFEPGDPLFIYSSAPYSRIMFEMEVEAVNLPYGDYIKDFAYWVKPADFEVGKKHNRYCKFKLVRRIESPSLHLYDLYEHGLKAAPQSPQANNPKSLLDYIESHSNYRKHDEQQ